MVHSFIHHGRQARSDWRLAVLNGGGFVLGVATIPRSDPLGCCNAGWRLVPPFPSVSWARHFCFTLGGAHVDKVYQLVTCSHMCAAGGEWQWHGRLAPPVDSRKVQIGI